MNEDVKKIVEMDIDIEGLPDEMFDDYGVQIVSIVDAPAIEEGFHYFSKEEFVYPRQNESEDEFIGRCMSDEKMKSEFPNEEQRLAVCYSYFEGEQELSYNDYPKSAKNAACRAVKWAEENGWGDCGTDVGKQRAHQLCKGENISEDTISRMASFARHLQHKDVPYGEGCGGLMVDAWGSESGILWAQRKLKELENLSCEGDTCSHHILSEDEQEMLLEWFEDDNNGIYLSDEDTIVDFTKNEFSNVGDVIKAIRSLDILKRLGIKRGEESKVFWRYSGPSAERRFCKAMMRLSKAGKIFSDEELSRMDGLNPGFGPRGSNLYSKLAWKGSVNCKHWWSKLKVFKNEDGKKVVIITNKADNIDEDRAMKSNNINHPSPNGATDNNASLRPRRIQAQKFEFSIDTEKRILLGPLMIPNKMILRRTENGEPFYIYFSRKTIEKMAERFLKFNRHNNTDINHDNNITTQNTLLETWISESIKEDKSYKYGFALPVGTWYVKYKINDDDTWNKIKSGELRGFSLAGEFINKMSPLVKAEKQLNDIKNILENVVENNID